MGCLFPVGRNGCVGCAGCALPLALLLTCALAVLGLGGVGRHSSPSASAPEASLPPAQG